MADKPSTSISATISLYLLNSLSICWTLSLDLVLSLSFFLFIQFSCSLLHPIFLSRNLPLSSTQCYLLYACLSVGNLSLSVSLSLSWFLSVFVYFRDIDYRLSSQPPWTTPHHQLDCPIPFLRYFPPTHPTYCLVACLVSHQCSSLQGCTQAAGIRVLSWRGEVILGLNPHSPSLGKLRSPRGGTNHSLKLHLRGWGKEGETNEERRFNNNLAEWIPRSHAHYSYITKSTVSRRS